MKVTELEITVHPAEPDAPPILALFHAIPGVGSVRVVVRTDDGVSGAAEIGFGRAPGRPNSLAAVIEHELKPVVLGTDTAFIRGTHEAMLRETDYCGPTGLALYGISMIDVALWDCIGKAHGVPCWQLWGAVRDRIPAYAMVGWPNYGHEKLQRVCAEAVEHGFRAVKIRGGFPTMEEDVERVKLARKAIGDDTKLMVDGGQNLTVAEAIRRGRALQDLGCYWWEEPIPAHDIDGNVAIAEALDIPLALGENLHGATDFARRLSCGAVDIVQPNMRRAGGPTTLLQIGTMAHAFDRRYASSQADGTVQLNVMACLPNALYLEADVLDPTSLPELTDGHISLPTGPGFDWE